MPTGTRGDAVPDGEGPASAARDVPGKGMNFQEDRPRFVCDVHLGKLARFLRLLGFDTVYRNDLEDEEIVLLARSEGRLALTRDGGILADRTIRTYRPGSIVPEEQLRDLLEVFRLRETCRPFSRCLDCNGDVEPVEREAVIARVPPRSGRIVKAFWQCRGWGKIYWHGSHYDRMRQRLAGWGIPVV